MCQLQGRPLPSAYAATVEEGGGGCGNGRGRDTEGSSLLRGSMEMSSLLEEGREASDDHTWSHNENANSHTTTEV